MHIAAPVLRPAAASLLLSVSMMATGGPTDASSQTRNQKNFLRSESAVLWDVDGTLVDRQMQHFCAATPWPRSDG